MRLFYLQAAFVLVLSVSAASAQQSGSLIVKDNQDDLCRRFKMHILVPSNEIDPQAEVGKPEEGVDYKMKVTNPCVQQRSQVAIVVPESLPDGGGGFFALPRFTSGSLRIEESQQKLREAQRARRPSVIEMMRGHR